MGTVWTNIKFAVCGNFDTEVWTTLDLGEESLKDADVQTLSAEHFGLPRNILDFPGTFWTNIYAIVSDLFICHGLCTFNRVF